MALNIAVKIEVIKGFYHDRESITDRGMLWRPKRDEAGFVSWAVSITCKNYLAAYLGDR